KLKELRNLTHDNAEQQTRLVRLEEVIEDKIDYMAHSLHIAHTENLNAAKHFISDARGREQMETIRALVEELKAAETELLRVRTEKDSSTDQLNMWIILSLLALLFLLVYMFITRMRKELLRRAEVELALRDQTTFQRTILDNTLYTIIACAPDGTIEAFNPAAEKMLGYKAEEVIGKHSPALFHDKTEMEVYARNLEEELGEPVNPASLDVFTKRAVAYGSDEREWAYITKGGERLTVLVSVSVRRDDAGNIVGFIGIAKDITERKSVERMKNEFISTVSHELRTPLTSIRGALGLVLGDMDEDLTEDVRPLLQMAHNNSERLTRLINNILDIEKMESGGIVFENKAIRIDTLLAEAVRENTSFAQELGVHLVIHNHVGDATVLGDKDRLLQVIANLLSNAIKFSHQDGTVQLRATREKTGIRISVFDNGPGVPQDFQKRIFEKFAQADSSDSRQKGGTGLGLSITKSIVESMDGELGFLSIPGETEFHFTLPELMQPAFSQMSRMQSDRKKVLICEDDHSVAELLRLLMEKEGFSCTVTHTARDARKMLSQHEFDALTLDLGLPDEDGLSFIRELREQENNIPIIVISAKAEDGEKTMSGEAFGVLDWMTKPVDADKLRQVMGIVGGSSETSSILYIEDDTDIVDIIAMSLRKVANVTHAPTLAEARYQLHTNNFDLAILDIQMPDGNGLSLLPQLNEHVPPIPVVILSVEETSREVQSKVLASMVKSVVTEERIIQTIKKLVIKREQT
ncbi:MAG: response regulator, partial [Alphaproteobacteria bacterium]|nr:response regulator [Alphaproteobacteria bacterium]